MDVGVRDSVHQAGSERTAPRARVSDPVSGHRTWCPAVRAQAPGAVPPSVRVAGVKASGESLSGGGSRAGAI